MDIDTVNEILDIIRNKNLSKDDLKKALSQYHESDVADAVPLLSGAERKAFFGSMTPEELGDLFPFLDSPEDYLENMPTEAAADIVESMDADDAVDILEEVDEDKAKNILNAVEKSSLEDINLIKQYDEDEIGSKITTNYIVIPKSSTIKEAMKILVKEAPENDNIANIFVVDDNNKYYGTIILKDLIIAREGSSLEDITKTSYPTLYATDKVSDDINEIKDIDLEIIPVLNEKDEILGVITSSDIIETVGDELGEDYVKFAGLTKEEDVEESFFESVKKRIPWLTLLLCMDVITSTVLSNYSWIFATMPALVLFQSLVLDTGGNAGTQSLAVTIRSLTQDQVNKKNFGKIMLKEFFTGLVDGLFAGLVGFAISFLFLIISKNYVLETGGTIHDQIMASLVVGIALASAIPLSTLAGMLFPIFFKKIHVDPAVASGPLITTLSDVCGVTIYYSFAILLFHLVV